MIVHMNTTTTAQAVTSRVTSAFAANGHKDHSTIADLIGAPVEEVSHMLSGQFDFTIERLVTIGDTLGIDWITLVGRNVAANENYLNTDEAAIFSGKKPDTIRKAIQSGRLTSAQTLKGGRHLVAESNLKAWMGCSS